MRALVIDDDADILQALSLSIQFRWPECEVVTAQNGEEGLKRFRAGEPDVVILDVGLPGLSGFDVLQLIRQASAKPVLMLTARNQEADIVRALEMGADDYVTKPAGYLELTARIQSLLRRAQPPSIPVPALDTYSHGGLTIHFPSRDVEVEGKSIPLTNTEYRLLYHLVRNAGRIVSHHDLLQSAWGSDNYGEDVVRVYVSRLRAKIEPNVAQPRYILTKSGLGYLFAGDAATLEHESDEDDAAGFSAAGDDASDKAAATGGPQKSGGRALPITSRSLGALAGHP
jgi:two-component system KDP operon response regulator KdpE